MKKYLSVSALLLFLFIARPVHADVLPEGKISVPICVKLSDIDQFPFNKNYFISVSVLPSKELVIDQLMPNECAKGYYKFAEHRNFAVEKADFPNADFSSIKGFDDSRMVKFDKNLPNDYIEIDSPTHIKAMQMIYGIESMLTTTDSDLNNVFVYKTSETKIYKDGTFYRESYTKEGVSIEKGLHDAIFTDVTPNTQFSEAILYLKDGGFISGYDDGSFQPDKLIDRAEFSKIIVNAIKTPEFASGCVDANFQPEYKYVYFPDVLRNLWYSDYVCAAKKENIIKGYPDGTFKPALNINLAEAYKIAFVAKYGPEKFGETQGENWYDTYLNYAYEYLHINGPLDPSKKISRGEMAQLIYIIQTVKPMSLAIFDN